MVMVTLRVTKKGKDRWSVTLRAVLTWLPWMT
ncbi:hypothetical protein EV668_3155 [Enterovirga rhinocerotis]|uniref:Uncharacterized protein n=1 Tax=Enterovirga rhinocerotis TaxID=1339210 RepID=A0A4R7C1D2_9HYPH|nr:hypothetical protein EV668_3155 [Enterovirga rhinocerotis]